MISYIVGELTEKNEGYCVVESGGIGFEILISSNSLSSLGHIGETIKINTYFQVKDDGMVFFGFTNLEEKAMFLKLINVNGIGPKNALNILSGMKLSDLSIAILKEDTTALTKIKGLGKKTAERLVLELKDKISITAELISSNDSLERLNENAISEACDTLISLGISKNEAYTLARANTKENSTVEDIIKNVLKNMGRY